MNTKMLGRALCALCLVLALSAPAALASDVVGFTVHADLPIGQLASSGYFNLVIEPGGQQQLHVQVRNDSPDEITVRVDINDATTTAGGAIVYVGIEDNAEESSAALYTPSLHEVATFRGDLLETGPDKPVRHVEENLITLAPYAQIVATIEVTMPDAPLEGQLLGGIVISKLDQAAQEAAQAIEIRSVYSYAIAVQLQNEAVQSMEPDFTLRSAAVGKMAGFDALMVGIDNLAPLVISGMQLQLMITPEGDGQPVWQHTTLVSMSPNAKMDYAAVLNLDNPLLAGRYTVTAILTYGDQIWTLQTPLEVA